MGKSRLFALLAGALLLASTAAHAATFTLDNVTFDTDGTITGSFAYDGSSVTNVSMVLNNPANPSLDGDYTAPPIFLFDSGTQTIFQFQNDAAGIEFRVTDPFSFSAPNPLVLGDSGSSVETPELLFDINSGSLDPTPLPAALPLFATGLGGLGLLGWRRKRKAQAVA
jgi:hypothetical protein